MKSIFNSTQESILKGQFKKNFNLAIYPIAILLLFLPLLFASRNAEEVRPEAYHSIVESKIAYFLSRYHYNHQSLSDSLSSIIFDQYISETWDPNRYYFYASDIKTFEKFRNQFDDFLRDGQLGPVFYMFNVFKERVQERLTFAKQQLEAPFDFTTLEVYHYKRDDKPWPLNRAELDEIWRKKVKYDALNLRLAGKDDAGIRETLTKRYERLERSILELDSEEVFELFMNSFTESFDPHTNYYSPINSENFRIRMSLSLEGIGAQLNREDEYTNVVAIIPGGPADKGGLLHAKDKIIGVGQGEDGEVEDVIGWKINDVVQKIRGKKGTTVRLQIIPKESIATGKSKIISIVRDKVKLEDRAAQADTLHVQHDGKRYVMGVIDIPLFYDDFAAHSRGESDYKSTTRDVKKLVEELNEKKVDGIIIDLRNNGGGSLPEAISLTGLFIEHGPVVQVRDGGGDVDVESDDDKAVYYDGPLAVLVNGFSASASEIFAAAIQDYERGIIVGNQTFGKGTVQNLIPLKRFVPRVDESNLGQLKLTIAKFYRITGESTQHKGVIPDILFPERYGIHEFGEASQKNALPWDKIGKTLFEKQGNIQKYLPKLSLRYKVRSAKNPEFKYLREDIAEANKLRHDKMVSLNEKERRDERDMQEAKKLKRINERRKLKGLSPLAKDDEIPEDEDEEKDVLLEETARIVADMDMLSKEGLTGYFK
ncbi:MAG: tail-specific protease [Calditrichaeota bacterium]|nr:MAG: tail-specific protease [Calditrichota bacterium]